MNIGVKKVGVGSLLSLSIILVFLIIPVNAQAAEISKGRFQDIIKESIQLLLESKEPTGEQSQKIQDLRQMIKKKEVSREQVHQIAKKEVSIALEKYALNRYEIKKMLKRAPEVLPSVTGEDLHKMIWGKIEEMFKEPLYIKVGSLAPEGTTYVDVPRKQILPHITKVSGGKVNFRLYVGGVMGEDLDILRKMDIGQMHCCGCSVLGVFQAAPEIAVFSLPLLFRNYGEVDHILIKYRKDIDAAFEKKGYILATLIDGGFFYIWTKNKVSNLDQIRKQKIGIWSGVVETATMSELGISPTPISAPEIITSLNTGLVNAISGPPAWILGTQVYPNLKYYITQPLFYSPGAVFYSNKIQEPFRHKYSDTLIDNFIEMLVYETQTFERQWIEDKLRPFENKCLEAFRKYGIKPVTLNKKDMATMNEASKRVWMKLADDVFPKDFLDRILNDLENYRR